MEREEIEEHRTGGRRKYSRVQQNESQQRNGTEKRSYQRWERRYFWGDIKRCEEEKGMEGWKGRVGRGEGRQRKKWERKEKARDKRWERKEKARDTRWERKEKARDKRW